MHAHKFKLKRCQYAKVKKSKNFIIALLKSWGTVKGTLLREEFYEKNVDITCYKGEGGNCI